MTRVVVRPYAQIALLVLILGVFGMYGVWYLTNGSFARRDWLGVGLGLVLVPASLVGVWRTVRLGAIPALGSYSRRRAERRTEQLRGIRAAAVC
ncbi:hypothetical protein AB0M02_36700 [Actinoplanes sp. NPDC051861]|uniref:hypothetical protein n=1 Tax=Actinoplanes sp. NPDC051861 TaxID=3155170 RepID=UPI00341693F1